jgi:hypothetical protein
MDSDGSTRALPRVSFLIRRSRDQRLVSTSPGLFAAAHVLHRLLAPRHPPCALVLLIRKEHVRCRYGVFKVRASSSSTPCGRCRSIRTSRCRPTCACHGPSKLNSVRPAPRGRHGSEVDVVLGELCHRTSPGNGPGSSGRAEQPPE